MMKVLAAESSDPQRLRRAKQYAADGSVLDIAVLPGVVSVEVQGSRSTPYLASIEVRPGNGMPLRRDLSFSCTCPDHDNFDGFACKHVLAGMLVFSDELLLEPELLDVWRRHDARSAINDAGEPGADTDDEGAASGPKRRRGHLSLVPPIEPRPTDSLAEFLAVPAGSALPAEIHLEPSDPQFPRRRELAEVLRDALAHTRIDWG
jgi:uncharacterized Zn finger protein